MQSNFKWTLGCMTNLLSKLIFDKLNAEKLEENDPYGVMAYGTWLPFYGIIKLPSGMCNRKRSL